MDLRWRNESVVFTGYHISKKLYIRKRKKNIKQFKIQSTGRIT